MQTNKKRRPYILTGVKSDENLVIEVLRITVMTVSKVFTKIIYSILAPLGFLIFVTNKRFLS